MTEELPTPMTRELPERMPIARSSSSFSLGFIPYWELSEGCLATQKWSCEIRFPEIYFSSF